MNKTNKILIGGISALLVCGAGLVALSNNKNNDGELGVVPTTKPSTTINPDKMSCYDLINNLMAEDYLTLKEGTTTFVRGPQDVFTVDLSDNTIYLKNYQQAYLDGYTAEPSPLVDYKYKYTMDAEEVIGLSGTSNTVIDFLLYNDDWNTWLKNWDRKLSQSGCALKGKTADDLENMKNVIAKDVTVLNEEYVKNEVLDTYEDVVHDRDWSDFVSPADGFPLVRFPDSAYAGSVEKYFGEMDEKGYCLPENMRTGYQIPYIDPWMCQDVLFFDNILYTMKDFNSFPTSETMYGFNPQLMQDFVKYVMLPYWEKVDEGIRIIYMDNDTGGKNSFNYKGEEFHQETITGPYVKVGDYKTSYANALGYSHNGRNIYQIIAGNELLMMEFALDWYNMSYEAISREEEDDTVPMYINIDMIEHTELFIVNFAKPYNYEYQKANGLYDAYREVYDFNKKYAPATPVEQDVVVNLGKTFE